MSNDVVIKKDSNTNNAMSRSNRNSKLYRQVYDGDGQDLENLPLSNNTDEIDIDSLKRLLARSEKPVRSHHEELDLDVLGAKKRNVDSEKVYDINKLLEKARYENKKMREPEKNVVINNSKSILETLGTGDYEGDYLKEKENKKEDNVLEDVSPVKLEMTREMKNLARNIAENPLTTQVMPDNDLSLDLLSDLKPSGNTIVAEPMKDKREVVEKEVDKKIVEIKKLEELPKFDLPAGKAPFFPMNVDDTSDIDIIKLPSSDESTKSIKKVDNDFFTSSYEFSRKDFTDYDEDDDSNGGNVLKIVLLVLAIVIFAGVIAYFILNYGINK